MRRQPDAHGCPPAFAAWYALAVVLLACHGSSPTEAPARAATLATAHGPITVYANDLPFDAARATAAIEVGYAKARAEIGPRIDAIRLDGMAVSVEASVYDGAAAGRYLPSADTVEMQAGAEAVIAHELQHRFCWSLGHSGDCCTCQDHTHDALCTGGYNLDCQRT
jgi:hypothetical protein